MTTRYLVQTREPGERWKTATPTLDLASAKSYADALWRMAWTPYGLDRAIPRHPFVRVTCKGAVVYEPPKVATS